MTSVNKYCGKKPSFSHLRTFGCVSCSHISNYCRKNLDAKSHACIILATLKSQNPINYLI